MVQILYHTDLRNANMAGALLHAADFSFANLRDADLCLADLHEANLNSALLICSNLFKANLRYADFLNAEIIGANLESADLSRAKNLVSPINYMDTHFERTPQGYIAYKVFNGVFSASEHWDIKPGSVIDEVVNQNRTTVCGCGINVAPLEWVKQRYSEQTIWKVLIRWEWLPGVCVPYSTDGNIRCEKVELVEVVE